MTFSFFLFSFFSLSFFSFSICSSHCLATSGSARRLWILLRFAYPSFVTLVVVVHSGWLVYGIGILPCGNKW